MSNAPLRHGLRPALACALTAVLALSACSAPEDNAAPGPPHIVVSILPQAGLVDRLAGGRFEVETLVPPGQGPHAYEPSPRQLARLAKAAAYFRIGVPFEAALMTRIESAMPHLRIVDLSAGIEKRAMAPAACGEHGHDHAHEHHTGAPHRDPHVWLGPDALRSVAKSAADALAELDPENAAEYAANLAQFEHDLAQADEEAAQLLAPLAGRALYVFHPAYGYFCDHYGLEQHAVEIEGKEPTPKQLEALIAQAREDNVKAIFIQPEFDRNAAQAVADAIGGSVAVLDPLAEDPIANLGVMAKCIAGALAS